MGNEFLKLSKHANLDKIKATADNLKQQKAESTTSQNSSSIFSSMVEDSVQVNSFSKGSYDDFAALLSGKSVDELTDIQKAQYELVASIADQDGDSKISQNELKALDMNPNNKIDQADIDALFKEIGIGSDASIDEIISTVENILTAEDNPVENKSIPSKSGAVYNDEDGTYSLTVEDYRDGKVQDDGEGGKRYPNGSYWGMVTNAYPELKEGDKEQVYNMIGEMNGFDWQTHGLYTGDKIKLPILEYDKNGNVTGYHTSEKVEGEKTEDKPTTGSQKTTENEKAKEERALDWKVNSGNTGKDADTTAGSLSYNYGKWTLDGKSCKFDEESGALSMKGATRSDKPSQYGYSYTLPNGTELVPHQGKYSAIDKDGNFLGQIDDVRFDSENETISFKPYPATEEVKTNAAGNEKGEVKIEEKDVVENNGQAEKPAANKEEDYSKLTDFVNQCKDNGFADAESLQKFMTKIGEGDYNLKDFIAEYDKNNSPKFMEVFDTRDMYTTDYGRKIADAFAEKFITSFGGAESEELAKYIDDACNNPDMGGFYLAGAPTLIQQIYSNTYDDIVENAVKDPTNGTTLSSFYQNGVYDSSYESGLQGLHKAEADYQENVKIMNEFNELYTKYANSSVLKQEVEYETYGFTDGAWDIFNKNYEGKNSIADIYEKFTKDGMGNGSINYSKYHISMYKEALEKLREYDKLMG